MRHNGLGIAVCAGLLARQPNKKQMMNSDKKNSLYSTASIAAIPCYALVPEWLFSRQIEKQVLGCIIFFEAWANPNCRGTRQRKTEL